VDRACAADRAAGRHKGAMRVRLVDRRRAAQRSLAFAPAPPCRRTSTASMPKWCAAPTTSTLKTPRMRRGSMRRRLRASVAMPYRRPGTQMSLHSVKASHLAAAHDDL
jgi:hypothetical protein